MLSRFMLAIGLCLIGAAAGWAQEESSIPPVGIGTFLHPVDTDASEAPALAQPTIAEQREHVHIFMLNGLDPLYLGNLNGLAGHLQALGFEHTRVYRLFQTRRLNRDIRAVRQMHPDARIVLLGFSLGANAARDVAHDLNRDGIRIDTLVYMGGDSIDNTSYSRPDNVGKVINITGHGLIFYGYDLVMNGADIDGAANLRVDARHILIPSRRETVALLSKEVVNLAQQPLVVAAPPAANPVTPVAAPMPYADPITPVAAPMPTPVEATPAVDDGRIHIEVMPPDDDDE